MFTPEELVDVKWMLTGLFAINQANLAVVQTYGGQAPASGIPYIDQAVGYPETVHDLMVQVGKHVQFSEQCNGILATLLAKKAAAVTTPPVGNPPAVLPDNPPQKFVPPPDLSDIQDPPQEMPAPPVRPPRGTTV